MILELFILFALLSCSMSSLNDLMILILRALPNAAGPLAGWVLAGWLGAGWLGAVWPAGWVLAGWLAGCWLGAAGWLAI